MVLDRNTDFFRGKRWFWDRKTNFFLGKRWFGREKQIFSLEKDGFGVKNHLFPRENQKNHLFGVWPHSVSKIFFFWFFWFFPRKKLVFLSRTIFFLGKSLFSCPKPSFPRKKLVFLSETIFFLGKTEKTIFLVSGRIASQKMVFLVCLVFPRKSWFSFPKPSFPRKSWFFTPKPPFS